MWWHFFPRMLSAEKRISFHWFVWLHISFCFCSAFRGRTWYPIFFSVPLLFPFKLYFFFYSTSAAFPSIFPLRNKSKKNGVRDAARVQQKPFFFFVRKITFPSITLKLWLWPRWSDVKPIFEKEKLEWLMWQSERIIMKINSNAIALHSCM